MKALKLGVRTNVSSIMNSWLARCLTSSNNSLEASKVITFLAGGTSYLGIVGMVIYVTSFSSSMSSLKIIGVLAENLTSGLGCGDK